MNQYKLITCIVQRGKADKAVDAALAAGAGGATVHYARGTGVRQKVGLIGKFINPEKEVIILAVPEKDLDRIFEAIVKAAELDKPAKGFAFVHSIEKAIGFLPQETDKN